MQLGAQAWLQHPHTQQLLAAFKPDELRFVGGAVRDALMNRHVGDVDCATTCAPTLTQQRLQQAGIKAIPTGLAHGTITAMIEHSTFEITTLRHDLNCDGRHAEVAFTQSWRDDAQRRDFTLNALYADAQGTVYDYTGGIADAQAHRIRFIGDASARIHEDALRILRFFRFFASHGAGAPNADAIAACQAQHEQIHHLSGERIQREMLKLLSSQNPLAALEAMAQTGVLAVTLGCSPPSLAPLATYYSALSPAQLALLRLAWLLPDATAARAVAKRWRLSNAQRDQLLLLHQHPYQDWPENTLQMQHVARHLAPEAYQLLLARNAQQHQITPKHCNHMLIKAASFTLPQLPVSGHDLIAHGIPAGKAIGAAMQHLDAIWQASDYTLSKAELLARL